MNEGKSNHINVMLLLGFKLLEVGQAGKGDCPPLYRNKHDQLSICKIPNSKAQTVVVTVQPFPCG